jgi:hypothetical protein
VHALSALAISAGTFQGTMPYGFYRWFGFSPDHGDGSLEAIVLIAVITIVSVELFPQTSRAQLDNRNLLGIGKDHQFFGDAL